MHSATIHYARLYVHVCLPHVCVRVCACMCVLECCSGLYMCDTEWS